jgi:hypothetical protein
MGAHPDSVDLLRLLEVAKGASNYLHAIDIILDDPEIKVGAMMCGKSLYKLICDIEQRHRETVVVGEPPAGDKEQAVLEAAREWKKYWEDQLATKVHGRDVFPPGPGQNLWDALVRLEEE